MCRRPVLLFLTLMAAAAPAQAQWWTPAPARDAAPAPAADTPARSGDYLALMDADRDGRVSPTEYQDWLSYAFDRMDTDRDGVLAAAEQPGGRGEVVTRTVYRERLLQRFRRQDLDRNGWLDARELAAPPQ